MDNQNIAETIRDLAASIKDVIHVDDDGQPICILPDGYSVHDLERYLPLPARIRASVALLTIAGLVAYTNRYKSKATTIFANPETGFICVVLDYHTPETNGQSWVTHKANFAPKSTEEWRRWNQKHDAWMGQREFAEFIENNVEDIRTPNGATMLEIASTLEAKASSSFQSGVRLDNGSQRLSFTTEIAAKAGEKGQLDIPLGFQLALRPFVGGSAYPVEARFRYKITDGKLTLRYQLVNPHKVIEAAVDAMVEEVAEKTEIVPFIGTAP